jgi:LCP family protein required for cell wall assembly
VHAASAAAPQPAAPRRPRRRRAARRAWLLLGVVLAALAGGGTLAARAAGGWLLLAARAAGFVAHFWQPQVAMAGGGKRAPTPVQPQEPFSVLVLGTEEAPAYAGPQLTDSIMVLSYDPQGKSATILSVPRDLWVQIPGFGHDRINTAYENGGVPLAKLVVEQTLGVPIEYYAIVNYRAFVNLVNDLGGVDVVVPQNIDDPCFPNPAENACTEFKLAAGPQHLDGETALKYIRERHVFAEGDIQRERDQQHVLMALKDALLQPSNLPRLGTILRDVFGAVETDVPYQDLPTLAAQVLQLPRTSIHTAVLDYKSGAVQGWTTPAGADVLLPNLDVIHQVTRQAFSGLLAPLGELTVQVFNGTPSPKPLATDFSQTLASMGVHTLPAGPADRSDYKDNQVFLNTAVLHLAPGQPVPTEAYMLGQMLGTSVQQASFPQSQAQIVVILGAAFPGA